MVLRYRKSYVMRNGMIGKVISRSIRDNNGMNVVRVKFNERDIVVPYFENGKVNDASGKFISVNDQKNWEAIKEI